MAFDHSNQNPADYPIGSLLPQLYAAIFGRISGDSQNPDALTLSQ